MSSKWHDSIGEERRQANLTARALGQADETHAEADADRNTSGDQHQQIGDIREFAREVSTALIEPVREPSAELRKKLQQHFDNQNPSHTRRYAEMTSNTNSSRNSKRTCLALAVCALIAAIPLGFHGWSEQRQSQSEVTVAEIMARGTAEVGPTNLVGDVVELDEIVAPFFGDVDTRNANPNGVLVRDSDAHVSFDDVVASNLVIGDAKNRVTGDGVTIATGTIDNVASDGIKIRDFPTATIQNLEINSGTGSALSIETTAGFIGDSTVTITDNMINGDSDPAVDIVANGETSSRLTVRFNRNLVTSFNDAFSAVNGPNVAGANIDGAAGSVTITSFADNNMINGDSGAKYALNSPGTTVGAVDALEIFNSNGTGLAVNTKVSGTTFNLDVAGNAIDTTNGQAVLLQSMTTNGMTFDSIPLVGSLSVTTKISGTDFNVDHGSVREKVEPEYSAEQYKKIVENPFRSPAETRFAKSTFSIDVDTASYANVRRFLNQNTLPPPAAVRIEEMVNYFDYDYPQPKGNTPFSVSTEVAECPWQAGHQLVRIGLKGKEIDSAERRPCNLVFLLDVSGSMSDQDKLPLLKRGLRMMLGELTESDRVTIVTYAGDAGLKLEATSGDQKKKLTAAIDSLQAGGSTNGSAGIHLAYQQAQQHFIADGNNRVIMATDGDLNVGVTDDNELVELIRKKAADGVFLTVLGFGRGNLQDAKLEGLADNGNGHYAYVDSLREARKVLVEQAMGSLVTIAKDVKIQVEFNPAEVASYRLISYENRALANRDFNNDKRDAGDIGAGHTVTALYEIVPAKQVDQPFAKADEPLKYQRTKKQPVVRASFTEAADSGELLTVWLRYKEPDEHESKKLEFAVKTSATKFNRSSKDLQFAASVAAFGMLLRNSEHCRNMTFAAIEETAAAALGNDPKGYRTEFLDLVRRASSLRPEARSSFDR